MVVFFGLRLVRRVATMAGDAPVVGVLVKLDGKHGAWPSPSGVGSDARFVPASTAVDLASKLGSSSKPTALLWIPGVAGSEAAAVLAAHPSIEWVHSFSAGVDGLAPFLDPSRAVATTNGRGAFSSSLAEYVMTGALYFNKQVPRCQRNAKEGTWEQFTMNVLAGKTMGFVGYGHIAKHAARLARAFGMRVVACRRSPEPDDIAETIYAPDDRLGLFRDADFVVCSLPGTSDTLNFCGAAEFAAMKPSAVFISLGRGAAVDEDALCDALRHDRIAGAALDVFKTEPLPRDSPFWDFGPDKLLLTAHNADLTEDYFNLGWQVWQDNFLAWRRAKEASSSTVDWATPFEPARGY
ncbi:hypothetical protein CTAYLR_009096 [Chrysophaeum taylorii]|uniref:D-isomer specific 2-hydroxyacid dehydrogenase NAD-binding domain-containing protein n=1 Tax=Chrysophaeum taylorii TaxID=2483200 RepID=A0AAD7UJR1_9STRA|nr:hypothetical protein CTAYLR_009096 [Chrysophaeum taylorii]